MNRDERRRYRSQWHSRRGLPLRLWRFLTYQTWTRQALDAFLDDFNARQRGRWVLTWDDTLPDWVFPDLTLVSLRRNHWYAFVYSSPLDEAGHPTYSFHMVYSQVETLPYMG